MPDPHRAAWARSASSPPTHGESNIYGDAPSSSENYSYVDGDGKSASMAVQARTQSNSSAKSDRTGVGTIHTETTDVSTTTNGESSSSHDSTQTSKGTFAGSSELIKDVSLTRTAGGVLNTYGNEYTYSLTKYDNGKYESEYDQSNSTDTLDKSAYSSFNQYSEQATFDTQGLNQNEGHGKAYSSLKADAWKETSKDKTVSAFHVTDGFYSSNTEDYSDQDKAGSTTSYHTDNHYEEGSTTHKDVNEQNSASHHKEFDDKGNLKLLSDSTTDSNSTIDFTNGKYTSLNYNHWSTDQNGDTTTTGQSKDEQSSDYAWDSSRTATGTVATPESDANSPDGQYDGVWNSTDKLASSKGTGHTSSLLTTDTGDGQGWTLTVTTTDSGHGSSYWSTTASDNGQAVYGGVGGKTSTNSVWSGDSGTGTYHTASHWTHLTGSDGADKLTGTGNNKLHSEGDYSSFTDKRVDILQSTSTDPGNPAIVTKRYGGTWDKDYVEGGHYQVDGDVTVTRDTEANIGLLGIGDEIIEVYGGQVTRSDANKHTVSQSATACEKQDYSYTSPYSGMLVSVKSDVVDGTGHSAVTLTTGTVTQTLLSGGESETTSDTTYPHTTYWDEMWTHVDRSGKNDDSHGESFEWSGVGDGLRETSQDGTIHRRTTTLKTHNAEYAAGTGFWFGPDPANYSAATYEQSKTVLEQQGDKSTLDGKWQSKVYANAISGSNEEYTWTGDTHVERNQVNGSSVDSGFDKRHRSGPGPHGELLYDDISLADGSGSYTRTFTRDNYLYAGSHETLQNNTYTGTMAGPLDATAVWRSLSYGWSETISNWFYDGFGVTIPEIEEKVVDAAETAVDFAAGAVHGAAEALNPLAAVGLHVPDIGPIYGHETAYSVGGVVGTVVGIAGSFAIGNVASGATSITACGSALQTAAKIYTTANTLIGFGAGATHIIQGKGQFGDYVSVLSGAASSVGWIRGKLSGVQNCFVAGTEVLVGSAAAPGVFSEKQIEDIRVGDEVWSKDQNNPDGPLELKRVKQVFVHTAYDLQKVSVTDETGNVETLDVTDEHPFYVEGIGWTSARELVIGEHLLGSDGKITTVTANVDDQHPDGVLVYNFEVEGDHTYFVADGQGTTDEFVWVHNACNLNSNNAVSRFGLYEIEVNGELYKIGKADLSRITQRTGLPTRLHQQVRQLRNIYRAGNVTGQVVHDLGTVTTFEAKLAELARLKVNYQTTGEVLLGNLKSFKPPTL